LKNYISVAQPVFYLRLATHEMCERVAKRKEFDDETTIYMCVYQVMLNTLLHTRLSETQHHQGPNIDLLIIS
jgi:hypothetical protein